ncbi:MAG: nucleotidyltransferase domain-containing protein [Pirellulaceae bacterium]|nr:nucleotidyltransferase domain-containing protein [Pirellulaceae bacterium]
MTTKARKSALARERWYRGADVPMSVIRRFARDVAERFQPDKIILFGSYATGKMHADSDVDIMVVMLARNQLDMAHKIHWTILPPFPMDIVVRRPNELATAHERGDSLVPEVLKTGKVLYAKKSPTVVAKGRSRSNRRPKTARKRRRDS